MDKAQQRQRMKAPVHGATHSLFTSKVSTLVCSSLSLKLREAFQSACRAPARRGHSPQVRGFQCQKKKLVRRQGSKLGGDRSQRKLLKPNEDQSKILSLDPGTSKCEVNSPSLISIQDEVEAYVILDKVIPIQSLQKSDI